MIFITPELFRDTFSSIETYFCLTVGSGGGSGAGSCTLWTHFIGCLTVDASDPLVSGVGRFIGTCAMHSTFGLLKEWKSWKPQFVVEFVAIFAFTIVEACYVIASSTCFGSGGCEECENGSYCCYYNGQQCWVFHCIMMGVLISGMGSTSNISRYCSCSIYYDIWSVVNVKQQVGKEGI